MQKEALSIDYLMVPGGRTVFGCSWGTLAVLPAWLSVYTTDYCSGQESLKGKGCGIGFGILKANKCEGGGGGF